MRKALAGVAVAGSLAVFLASCGFGLQAFSLLAGSLEPGDKTIARFALRPLTEEKEKLHQFVLVGVPTDGDVTVGKATWGTNGKFAGPLKMPVSPDLASTLVAEGTCGSSGLQFEDITGMKWKGFTTPKKIADRGLVGQKATTDVVVRAKSTAT
ncbi:MAG TPA: hypothetical protein VF044_08000, partial [Actinomycetota bacterium]